jgi:fibro-slime domain-containing protein
LQNGPVGEGFGDRRRKVPLTIEGGLMKIALVTSALALTLGGAVLAAPAAHASAVTASFYVLSPTNPDVGENISGLTTGLVNATLGPDGLPVASALSNSYPSTSANNFKDVNAAGELLWWTPQAGKVSFSSTSTVTLPYSNGALFPPGYSSDGAPAGYVSARFDATFSAPAGGSVTFSLGSDDDAWIFLDGQLVVDNGGVHGDTVAPTTVSNLSAGTHTVDVFYADRYPTQASLNFNADVTLNPVPEPASIALLGGGLLGLGGIISRRRAARS